jgi:ATP-dependent Lhr-like helicase
LPVPVDELGPLDPAAVAAVLEQVAPHPRDPDELHDLLLSLVAARPVEAWRPLFDQLVGAGRAAQVDGGWVATERRDMAGRLDEDDLAAAECVRGHLELAGPVSVEDLTAEGPLPGGSPSGVPLRPARVRTALARLEAEGSAIELPDGRWCARHLLVRLHGASRARRRRSVEPASQADFVRFLARWQHVAPGTRQEGRAGLLAVIEQLQGLELAAGDWESQVLPARVVDYDPRWLDELCLAGEVAWGRLTPRPARPAPAEAGEDREAGEGREGGEAGEGGEDPEPADRRGSATPSPATPLALVHREDLSWVLEAVRGSERPARPAAGPSAEVLEALERRGACFRAELAPATGRLPAEVDEGLWDLVARGLATADAFSAVRSLLSARDRWRSRQRRRPPRRAALGLRRAEPGSGLGEGRWSLLPDPSELGRRPAPAGLEAAGLQGAGLEAALDDAALDELAEAVAWQLLARWGVVTWELWSRESFRLPWRLVVRALRRLEARGLALGGRFVGGLSGEQYALAEAADQLAEVRRTPDGAEPLEVAAADPLNLTGVVVPGERVPAVRHRRVAYRGGIPLGRSEAG